MTFVDDIENVPGRASKVDKWKYNDILNDIARHALYAVGTPNFNSWSKRFYMALRIVNIKNLPLRSMLDKQYKELKKKFIDERIQRLRYNDNIWYDPIKRDIYLDKWEEEFWEHLLDYCLDLATKAGFTLHLDNIDESVALRM